MDGGVCVGVQGQRSKKVDARDQQHVQINVPPLGIPSSNNSTLCLYLHAYAHTQMIRIIVVNVLCQLHMPIHTVQRR